MARKNRTPEENARREKIRELLQNSEICEKFQKQKNHSNPKIQALNVGAAGRIRTADLILTKDALYRLSYSSIKMATRNGLEPSTSSVTG